MRTCMCVCVCNGKNWTKCRVNEHSRDNTHYTIHINMRVSYSRSTIAHAKIENSVAKCSRALPSRFWLFSIFFHRRLLNNFLSRALCPAHTHTCLNRLMFECRWCDFNEQGRCCHQAAESIITFFILYCYSATWHKREKQLTFQQIIVSIVVLGAIRQRCWCDVCSASYCLQTTMKIIPKNT